MGASRDPPISGEREGCPGIGALEASLRDEDARAAVESHARSCPACRASLAEMRGADSFLDRFRTRVGRASVEAPASEVRAVGYEILGMVGFGGQGAVYRARQEHTGRMVAIKVPSADTFRRASARFRFEREIELTARLEHPGIVRVLGTAELDDGRVGCVMDFVEGQPLDEWAAARRALGGRRPVREIVGALAAVADAIAYAHLRAVVHRDLKPSNIIVTAEGEPRVLDFGLAKALGESGRPFATLTGAFVGTLAYAAPEQLSASPDAIDIRTDVYALGLVLYQTVTGRLPFDPHAPTTELIRSIREGEPPRPSAFAPWIGDELDAVILRAIARDRDRRYASAVALRDDLHAWLDGRAVSARLDRFAYRARKTLRRHRWVVAGAAIALSVLGVVVAQAMAGRAQTLRARIADAAREARTLESHWWHVAEARSIAADNFEPGERMAWDALLDPDPALIEKGLEGERASAPPSLWALREMYLRTPVTWTVPGSTGQPAAFDLERDELLIVDVSRTRLTWWNVRDRSVVRTLATDMPDDSLAGLRGVISGGARVLFGTTDGLWMVDAAGHARAIASGTTTQLAPSRVVVSRNEGRGLECLDLTTDPPRTLWSRDFSPDRALVVVADASNDCFCTITRAGTLRVLRSESGEILLERSSEATPRFQRVVPTGCPGEFWLLGLDAFGIIHGAEEPRIEVMAPNALMEGVKSIAANPGTPTFLLVSDRGRLGVASHGDSFGVRREVPSLSVRRAFLPREGDLGVLELAPSGRLAALELEPRGVRRLAGSNGTLRGGSSTVFDAVFSPDSRTLTVAGIDGSIRRYDTATGEPTILADGIPGGVTLLAAQDDCLYAGTHHLSSEAPSVIRVRDGGLETIHTFDRWISGLAAGADGSLWVSTGSGMVVRLDTTTDTIRATRSLTLVGASSCRALARSAPLGVLLVGPSGNGIEILDELTLEPLADSVPTPHVHDLAVSPTHPGLIASGDMDGGLALWRLTPLPDVRFERVRTLGQHAGAVYSVAFSPDGRLLASGGGASEARDVRIWDVATGRELLGLDLFENGVFRVTFSPDGRWLAAVGEGNTSAPDEGGQAVLIDLRASDRYIAGNLEYHVERFAREQGHEPSQAEALRRWAREVENGDARP